jgi:hypothetical protein
MFGNFRYSITRATATAAQVVHRPHTHRAPPIPASVPLQGVPQRLLGHIRHPVRLPQDAAPQLSRGHRHFRERGQGQERAGAEPRSRLPIKGGIRPGARTARVEVDAARRRRRLLRRLHHARKREREPARPAACEEPERQAPSGRGHALARRQHASHGVQVQIRRAVRDRLPCCAVHPEGSQTRTVVRLSMASRRSVDWCGYWQRARA